MSRFDPERAVSPSDEPTPGSAAGVTPEKRRGLPLPPDTPKPRIKIMRYQPPVKNRAPKHRPLVRTASMIAEDKARAALASTTLARLEARLTAKKAGEAALNPG